MLWVLAVVLSSARPDNTKPLFTTQALISSQQTFTVSDPSLPDNPIVFASQGFLHLTGYKMDEVSAFEGFLLHRYLH
jgi:hypothetical protein